MHTFITTVTEAICQHLDTCAVMLHDIRRLKAIPHSVRPEATSGRAEVHRLLTNLSSVRFFRSSHFGLISQNIEPNESSIDYGMLARLWIIFSFDEIIKGNMK